MIRRILCSVAALALLALIAPRQAEAAAAAGSVAAPYLKMPMGARATGMGEAFSGVADDTSCLYYNPGGLAQIDSTQAQLMHLQGFGGINYEHLAVAAPAENLGIDVWGSLGLSYTLITIEDIQRTKTKKQVLDDYNAGDTSVQPDADAASDPNGYSENYGARNFKYTSGGTIVGLSYAWQATKSFSLGATAKFINQKVESKDNWGYAADLGMFIKSPLMPGVGAGLVLQNLGKSPDENSSLPMMMRVGIGYGWDHPFSSPYNPSDIWNIGMDVVLPVVPIDGPTHFNFGTEYKRWFGNNSGAIRVGYRFPTDLDMMAGMTCGAGYGYDFTGATVSLDYALVPYGVLGMSHRVSVTGAFGVKPRPTPTPERVSIPTGVQATGGDRSAQVYWKANPEKISGYNLYLAYKPAGPWYKLNKAPIKATWQRVGSLYNGVTTYFSVTAISNQLAPGAATAESNKSTAVGIIPRAGGAYYNPATNPQNRPAGAAQPAAAKPAAAATSLPTLPGAAPATPPAAGTAPALPPLPGATAPAAKPATSAPGAPPDLPPLP